MVERQFVEKCNSSKTVSHVIQMSSIPTNTIYTSMPSTCSADSGDNQLKGTLRMRTKAWKNHSFLQYPGQRLSDNVLLWTMGFMFDGSQLVSLSSRTLVKSNRQEFRWKLEGLIGGRLIGLGKVSILCRPVTRSLRLVMRSFSKMAISEFGDFAISSKEFRSSNKKLWMD